MKNQSKKYVKIFSNLAYVFGCVILFLIALCIIFSAVWSIIVDIISPGYTVYKILDEVGLIIFSIAVIDVAKYLMFEEVFTRSEEKVPSEFRRTLTKFAVIIASALALEGLVLTIEIAKLDVTKMLYPVSVLITSTIFFVGIGVYQKLNASAEKS